MIKKIEIQLTEKEQRKMQNLLGLKDNPNNFPIINKYNTRIVHGHKEEVAKLIAEFVVNHLGVKEG